jgi:DNA-binding NarL/FixJ family response regulator
MDVVIGSDNVISRLGMRALLEQVEGVRILAGTSVLEACGSTLDRAVDAVVLDANFSLETARVAASILARFEGTAVVLVGHSPAAVWMAARVNSGRALILDSAITADGLVAAMRVSRKELADSAAGNGSDRSGNHDTQSWRNRKQEELPQAQLSSREWEVLSIMAAGRTDKEIARELVLSQHTVKGHVRSVLRKLQVPNRTAAAAAFVALIPPAFTTFTAG